MCPIAWGSDSLCSCVACGVWQMEAYRLYTVVPRLVDMIEQLTNWYIRMNKDRFSGGSGDDDRKLSLCTLYEVLLIMCRMMAPLTPFFVESQYSNLKRALSADEQLGSVHFDMIPEVRGDRSTHRPTMTHA